MPIIVDRARYEQVPTLDEDVTDNHNDTSLKNQNMAKKYAVCAMLLIGVLVLLSVVMGGSYTSGGSKLSATRVNATIEWPVGAARCKTSCSDSCAVHEIPSAIKKKHSQATSTLCCDWQLIDNTAKTCVMTITPNGDCYCAAPLSGSETRATPTRAPSLWPPWLTLRPRPTFSPSFAPSLSPTLSPSPLPTLSPTKVTTVPTLTPSLSPTTLPTTPPTLSPTLPPTLPPTCPPSQTPTLSPTALPSFSPTPSPLPTALPTQTATATPTAQRTTTPSLAQSQSPTKSLRTESPVTLKPVSSFAPSRNK